ncbi:hypothetical protein FACS1894186_5930 [Alphaproteobacteria bacterium]|nr:hypothetical protein FACS1894186_5930 [Alphaproteobacteria bacterium]
MKIKEIIAWHCGAFPDATFASQLAKVNEEYSEFMRTPEREKTVELADMFIAACGLCRFDRRLGLELLRNAKHRPEGQRLLSVAVDDKMKINLTREWVGDKHKGE